MSFERPWVLFLLIVLLLWAILKWRRGSLGGFVAVTAVLLGVLVLAVSKPVLVLRESRMAVQVLADTSAGISDEDLRRESDLICQLESARGEHSIQVIPFGRSTPKRIESMKLWRLLQTPGPAGSGADMERAVRDAIAHLPAGRVPRIVILSDGQENLGRVLRAAGQARMLGIPIDTIPLAGRPDSGLRLDMATIPPIAFSGEHFPIDLTVTSPRSTTAEIVLSTQSQRLEASRVLLNPGVNRVRVTTSLEDVGVVELSVAVYAENLGGLRFSQSLTLRQPRALFISKDRRSLAPHWRSSLASAHFQVRYAAQIPADLADQQFVLLNQWNLNTISFARRSAIEEFVKQGGLLGLVGAQKESFAVASGREDPLQRTLPARIVPSKPGPGSCFVLVLEKSSSMDGKRMGLAKLVALQVVENLRRNDKLGVLAFDNAFRWAVPIRTAIDRGSIDDAVERITPSGGTRVVPALSEALRRILAIDARQKHIVLFTDETGGDLDALALARRAAAGRVTISVVELGEREDRASLSRLATWTGGKSYIVSNPGEVEPTVLRDTIAHIAPTAPAVDASHALSNQGEMFPYFIPKPRAQLVQGAGPCDPQLIRWQYGLGHVQILAPSGSGPGYCGKSSSSPKGVDEFWKAAVGDLPARTPKARVSAEYGQANAEYLTEHFGWRCIPRPRALQSPPWAVSGSPAGRITGLTSSPAISSGPGTGRPQHKQRSASAGFRSHRRALQPRSTARF
jgi:hypothetical protein